MPDNTKTDKDLKNCHSMIILGINDAQTDAGVALSQDETVLCAVNEERFSRVKIQGGFPHKALEYLLKTYPEQMAAVDCIAVAGINTPPHLARKHRILQKLKFIVNYPKTHKIQDLLVNIADFRLQLTYKQQNNSQNSISIKKTLRKTLPKQLHKKKIYLVDHHYAHGCAAYYRSGFKDALVVSFDGNGDGYSGKIYTTNNNKLQQKYVTQALDSFGEFYSLVTVYLGFKAHKHEGKITGLAAFGNYNTVREPFPFILDTKMHPKYQQKFGLQGLAWLEKQCSQYKREDIAAWLQHHTEQYVVKIIQHYLQKYKQKSLCLAGGLFANVKVNEKLHELQEVQHIFIYPAMGDVGLADGATCAIEQKHRKIKDVYLGPEYSDLEIEKTLQKYKVTYSKEKNIEKQIATLLAQQNSVARFNGRMEYGPRALGNRSILVSASNQKINQTLNTKLKRTEFMPFAPAILKKHAEDCLIGYKGAEHAAEFMTIAFKTTEFMQKKCPAAVHIDGTCRPQIVSQKTNVSLYKIVQEYYSLTGIPAIINTSFNIHEEPIVMTPEDAIRGFLEAKLDYLAIGKYLVKNTSLRS